MSQFLATQERIGSPLLQDSLVPQPTTNMVPHPRLKYASQDVIKKQTIYILNFFCPTCMQPFFLNRWFVLSSFAFHNFRRWLVVGGVCFELSKSCLFCHVQCSLISVWIWRKAKKRTLIPIPSSHKKNNQEPKKVCIWQIQMATHKEWRWHPSLILVP